MDTGDIHQLLSAHSDSLQQSVALKAYALSARGTRFLGRKSLDDSFDLGTA